MKKKPSKIVCLDKFINRSLYDPDLGYYMRKFPFGKSGDFITSPNISVLFSEMILIWTLLFWESLKCPKKFNIIELGSGNGEMIYQFLNLINKFPSFKKSTNFYIIEKSNYLKKFQKERLKGFNVKWVDNLKKIKKGYNFFFGNEFLDSFPIKQFEKINNKWFEKYVEEKKGKRKLINIPINKKKILNFDMYKNEKFIEISYNQVDIISDIASNINRNNGGVLFVDYGYYGKKMFNSIQCIKNHKKVKLLDGVGERDITHLINFKLLKQILEKNGLKVNGYTTQGEFLKKMGIFERAEILSKKTSFLKKSNIYFRLKRLTDKNQMGNLFKVIFATKKGNKFDYGFTNV